MSNSIQKEYSIYSEFDLEQHKNTYKNYLEVVMHPSGRIEYAVPSHQEKLIHIAIDKLHITREELNSRCPEEYYFDFMTWLCQITGCIAIWTDGYKGNPNRIQHVVLQKLSEAGVLKISIKV